jgi:hypothetical protein
MHQCRSANAEWHFHFQGKITLSSAIAKTKGISVHGNTTGNDIGYSHNRIAGRFGPTFDLAVAYGRPHATSPLPAIYSTPTTQANVDQKQPAHHQRLARTGSALQGRSRQATGSDPHLPRRRRVRLRFGIRLAA